jgi:hypothetical protein
MQSISKRYCILKYQLSVAILLPLGLPDTNEFWAAPAEMWTAQKVWGGKGAPNDHAVD